MRKWFVSHGEAAVFAGCIGANIFVYVLLAIQM